MTIERTSLIGRLYLHAIRCWCFFFHYRNGYEHTYWENNTNLCALMRCLLLWLPLYWAIQLAVMTSVAVTFVYLPLVYFGADFSLDIAWYVGLAVGIIAAFIVIMFSARRGYRFVANLLGVVADTKVIRPITWLRNKAKARPEGQVVWTITKIVSTYLRDIYQSVCRIVEVK